MRTDGVYSEHGAGSGNGSETQASSFSIRSGRDAGRGDRTVEKKTWFEPLAECTDDFCPIPQHKVVDVVNHPPHYTDGGIECIEAIEAQLTIEEYRGYLKGNCVKYLWRERHKGGVESLKKAQWYLERLIQISED